MLHIKPPADAHGQTKGPDSTIIQGYPAEQHFQPQQSHHKLHTKVIRTSAQQSLAAFTNKMSYRGFIRMTWR